MPDKKKMATVILSKMKSGKEEMGPIPTNEVGDEMDSSAGLDAAAEEVLQAIQAQDPKSLKSALKSMIEMCMDEYEASEESSEIE